MSSVQLLDKTRKIGKLLHNNNSSKVVFNDICTVMREILRSNVLVISKKGKVLGVDNDSSVEVIQELIKDKVGGLIDNMLNERMLSVLSTKENVNLETLGFENTDVKSISAVVLGCTHYPFVRQSVKKLLPEANLYDGGAGTARQVKRCLEKRELLNKNIEKGNVIFENSLNTEHILNLSKRLLDEKN